MSAPNQSMAEKKALLAAWKSHPHVQAFSAAVEAHVRENNLDGLDGMNEVLQFACRWQRDHGFLPDSGILCD